MNCLGRGIVIEKVGSKVFPKGKKTRVRYPSMMGGYITHTYVSKEAALADIENLNGWQRRRAKLRQV